MNDGIDAFEKKLDTILTVLVNYLLNFLNSALVILMIPFIAFYMLKDFHLIKRAVWYLTPKSWRQQGLHFLRDVDESLGSYIRGQLLVCVIIGGMSALTSKDRKSTRLNSSHVSISYAVFCLKKKNENS